MFSGLSAFPLTPMNENSVNEKEFIFLIKRLVLANVNSIGVLGSTGNYAYLSLDERINIANLAIEHAKNIPVIVNISALRTKDVLKLAENAEEKGANAVLLSPISYQTLTQMEVLKLYETINSHISLPIVVYDNPSTTHFNFSDELLKNISNLKQVKSIKIPSVSNDLTIARRKINHLRSFINQNVTLGISGDSAAVNGLIAGCDLWYSVIGGLFPEISLKLVKLIEIGKNEEASIYSESLSELWNFFTKYGSLRVIATIAELQKLITNPSLPLPLSSLSGIEQKKLINVIEKLNLY